MKDVGRFGQERLLSIRYQKQFSDSLWGAVSLTDYDIDIYRFQGDAYRLLAFGNRQFAGERVSLGPIRGDQINIQKLGFHVGKVFTSGIEIYGGLSLVKGVINQQLRIEKADLFTALDGSSIEVDLDYDYMTSRQDKSAVALFNGFGAALDFGLRKQLTEKLTIFGEVKDFGVVSWRDQRRYRKDTSFTFKGVVIDDITNFEPDSITFETEDGKLVSLLDIPLKRENIVQLLPIYLSAGASYQLNDRLNITAVMYYRYVQFYVPRIHLIPRYSITDWLTAGLNLAHGGLGGSDIGLTVETRINEHFMLQGDLFYLESTLLPRKTAGQGFSLKGVYRF
jgi:hypothetical protein